MLKEKELHWWRHFDPAGVKRMEQQGTPNAMSLPIQRLLPIARLAYDDDIIPPPKMRIIANNHGLSPGRMWGVQVGHGDLVTDNNIPTGNFRYLSPGGAAYRYLRGWDRGEDSWHQSLLVNILVATYPPPDLGRALGEHIDHRYFWKMIDSVIYAHGAEAWRRITGLLMERLAMMERKRKRLIRKTVPTIGMDPFTSTVTPTFPSLSITE